MSNSALIFHVHSLWQYLYFGCHTNFVLTCDLYLGSVLEYSVSQTHLILCEFIGVKRNISDILVFVFSKVYYPTLIYNKEDYAGCLISMFVGRCHIQ